MHADFRESYHRQAMLFRFDRKSKFAGLGDDSVHQFFLQCELSLDPLPLIIVEAPCRQEYFRSRQLFAGELAHLPDALHKTLGTPRLTFRAAAAAGIVGPDPDRAWLEIRGPVELLAEHLQDVFHAFRLARTDRTWIDRAAAAAACPKFRRRIAVGLVAGENE